MTVAARGQSYPRTVIHKRKHHKEGNHVRNRHDREREASSQMKWNMMRSFPLPVVFETANTTRRGKLLLVVFKMRRGKPLPIAFQPKEVRWRGFSHRARNGRKGDGGSPSSSRFKQKCNEEGFPIMFKMENATRMGLPLPVVSETKENATGRGSPSLSCLKRKTRWGRDSPSLSHPKQKKMWREGVPPSLSCLKHKRTQRGEGKHPLLVVFKMKNVTRKGFPLPVASETKENATRREESLLVVFETEENMTRRGFPLLMFETQENATRGVFPFHCVQKERKHDKGRFPSLSRLKQKKMWWGGFFPSSLYLPLSPGVWVEWVAAGTACNRQRCWVGVGC